MEIPIVQPRLFKMSCDTNDATPCVIGIVALLYGFLPVRANRPLRWLIRHGKVLWLGRYPRPELARFKAHLGYVAAPIGNTYPRTATDGWLEDGGDG